MVTVGIASKYHGSKCHGRCQKKFHGVAQPRAAQNEGIVALCSFKIIEGDGGPYNGGPHTLPCRFPCFLLNRVSTVDALFFYHINSLSAQICLSFSFMQCLRQVACRALKRALHGACVTGEVPMKWLFTGERDSELGSRHLSKCMQS